MRIRSLLLCCFLIPACGSDETAEPGTTPDASSPDAPEASTDAPETGIDAGSDSGQDAAEEDSGPQVCGTGNRALPDGLVELVRDDGIAVANLRGKTWTVEVNGNAYDLNDNPLWEAVRFELEHPARVHGFSVQWAAVPDQLEPDHEVFAGLYADFGYNGFDFWSFEPLWSGSRCNEDIHDGEWIDYVFDTPVEIEHPGLVYVAHLVDGDDDPVFPFDEATPGSGNCETFDECSSAMNLPEAETASFFNGVSFPFQYDYLVRLHVEYTDDLAPQDRIFQAVAFEPRDHVSFGDFDNDGWDDLITSGPKLFRNDGAGGFVDVTSSSGIEAMGITGTGGVFGDYDNDGCLDLFVYAESTTAADSLLHSNCDGTFDDLTASAGIVDEQTYNNCGGNPANIRAPSAAAAWLDVDSDGYLDVFMANHICWDTETYYEDTVFHNLGDGTFEEWTATHGFSPEKRPSRGAAPVDFDGDGDVDLFVNAYRLRANQMFVNQGDGTVQNKAFDLNLAGTFAQGAYGHTIGAAWGDLDNDMDFDLVAANLAHPRFFDFSDKTQVLIQETSSSFVDITGEFTTPASDAGLRYQETHSVPALADFDNDGNLDLVITCIYDGRPTDFYRGNGDGTFRLDSYHAGITTENGWGVSVSDFDNDGDPDVFAHVPFVNELSGTGKGHWVQVRVIGNVDSNWNAIGSTVRVTTSGTTRIRHVQGGSGKGGQDSQYLHFGVQDATGVSEIEVTFPGGKTVTYAGPFDVDQRIWLFEDGAAHTGWAMP